MAARIPPDVETAVVTNLYADADRLSWISMTPQQHSAQYDHWVVTPNVGGRLTQFLSASAARVWIKDGPMKEFSRATSGVGKYAKLVPNSNDLLEKVVRKALGDGWEPLSETLKVKPLRVTAPNGEDDAIVTWAPATGLKHMVWAALTASVAGDPHEWTLCVTGTFTRPTPANEKELHVRLAERCGLRVVHVTV